jgi:hypothetical protein
MIEAITYMRRRILDYDKNDEKDWVFSKGKSFAE